MFKRRRPNPGDRVSPLEAMAFEADVVGLLGKSATEVDRSGDKHRISYDEASAIRAKLRAQLTPFIRGVEHPSWFEGQQSITVATAVLPETLSDTIMDSIVEGMTRVADGSMTGHQLSRFSVVTRFLSHGWYGEDSKHVEIQGHGLFDPTIQAASHLTYAVAMLEGNLPPNDLGYRADEHTSLANKTLTVSEELSRAESIAMNVFHMSGEAQLSVFGNFPDTVQVINDVVLRAEMHRPTFMGSTIGDPFPRISI